ncbi:HSP20-like chaperone [Pyrrhoderma noxium]|uniref:HSP20-like chaperone n=1 Tax=Pyrrhoderma noxium TaxID=2282107 RepID=A0A286UAJ0_9AGAM|nr:HSP20-like chaperone [Pyrrhoderma noxium]
MHNQRKPQLHPLTPSYFHHHSPSISMSSGSGSSSLGPVTPVDADEVFIGQLWEQVRSSKRPSSDNFIPAALQQALDEEERERAREREFEREKEREREQPREKEHISSGTRSGMESMIKGYGYGLSAAAVAASPAAAAKPVIAPNMSQTPSSSRRRKSIVYRESSDKRNMVVILELPGVDKADVHVTFQPKRLVVSYKTVSETEHREFDRVIQETVERRVARALPLPETVRPASVSANWKDSRLFIMYPNVN